MNFQFYLSEQIKKHSCMRPQDVVKLCYQAAFGAEHLLSDVEAAKRYFDAEFAEVDARDGVLCELLSDDVCRVDLGVWKAKGLPSEWLFNMFAASAHISREGSGVFLECLDDAEEYLRGAEVNFSLTEWLDFMSKYKDAGMPPVHHSDTYRTSEKPAYRIVDRKFLDALEILEKAARLSPQKGAGVIAIDGRAAAGKSTLAELLRVIMDAAVVHMDDFFLPLELRTAKRFSEVGGNIHYERFCREVLPYVGCPEAFGYRVFDCGNMTLGRERQVARSDWRVVEGSYSLHPHFGSYADLSVFCDVDPDEQMRRIIERNGKEMARIFKTQWIPPEEQYFDACDIRGRADHIYKRN